MPSSNSDWYPWVTATTSGVCRPASFSFEKQSEGLQSAQQALRSSRSGDSPGCWFDDALSIGFSVRGGQLNAKRRSEKSYQQAVFYGENTSRKLRSALAA